MSGKDRRRGGVSRLDANAWRRLAALVDAEVALDRDAVRGLGGDPDARTRCPACLLPTGAPEPACPRCGGSGAMPLPRPARPHPVG